MPRTAQKVEDLVSEDPAMRNALEVVLDRAEANGGTVEWADVDDDLSSGQWGRLIEKGVLRSASGDGFEVRDPAAVRAALDGDTGSGSSTSATGSSDADDGGKGWSTYDKMAGLGALGLFLGYSVGQVRNAVGSALDVVLGPIEAALPFYAVILVLAMVTGLYSTLLQANLMDTEKMGEYQERMKDIQDRYKAAKESGDESEVERINEERMDAMGDQMGMMKEQFRPMVWIMLLTIPVFLWLYWMILENPGDLGTVTMPLIGQVDWTASTFVFPAWILWYFVCSMGFTQIIRKALNISTSPTTS
ncbi:DUF106 domain-containing protein [Halomarina litorea]|uniref:DUF106 domain-containing protein n=1 Tax=Halomarina litorea TaxID=2961595 RepID=UPI0020C3D251|nr:DUF106 domain-containing protein [Halomarina sp. BCD28]